MIDEIIYKPRTGDEMRAATGGAPLHRYSDICKKVYRYGAARVLEDMFHHSLKHIILLQDPEKMNSGHWMGLSYNPSRGEIYFFSTYGGKPDFEKNKWLAKSDQHSSFQHINALNDGLKDMYKKGYRIHFNDHPYQKEGDKTATCGIWTAAFLNSGMNPDEFYRFNVRNHLDAEYYFHRYFDV